MEDLRQFQKMYSQMDVKPERCAVERETEEDKSSAFVGSTHQQGAFQSAGCIWKNRRFEFTFAYRCTHTEFQMKSKLRRLCCITASVLKMKAELNQKFYTLDFKPYIFKAFNLLFLLLSWSPRLKCIFSQISWHYFCSTSGLEAKICVISLVKYSEKSFWFSLDQWRSSLNAAVMVNQKAFCDILKAHVLFLKHPFVFPKAILN